MAKGQRRAGPRKAKRSATRSRTTRKAAARRRAAKTRPAKKIGRKTTKKAHRARVAGKRSLRKETQMPATNAPIEAAIIDVIEEPVPGVVVVSEFEAVRVAVPDSDEEDETPA